MINQMNKNKFESIISSLNNIPQLKRSINESVLIIDGLNTFLRSFCTAQITNAEGHHIGGLIGFLKSVGYAIKTIKPTRTIIVFDGPGGSFPKQNLYPGYKANRDINKITNYKLYTDKDEEVESIEKQMNRLISYLKCLPLDLFCIGGLEADDIMSYISLHLEKDEETKKITIMSTDQDFLQLTSDKIEIYSPTKKKFYTPKEILSEYKVHPNNFIIYKTLLGDNSDNLPGVNKLGEKKLIKYFPEIQEEKIILLEDIFNKCKNNVDKHFLYNSVLEYGYQLKINYILMNLKELNISNENKEFILNQLKTPYKEYNKIQFLKMYYLDNLGSAINNVEIWVELFKELINK